MTSKSNGRRFQAELEREAGRYIRILHATMNDPQHRKGFDRTANELMEQITDEHAEHGADFWDGRAIRSLVFRRAYGHRVSYRGRRNGMSSGKGARRDEARARKARLARLARKAA